MGMSDATVYTTTPGTTQPILVEPDWRLACDWLNARNIFFASQSTEDEHWYATSSDDLLDLIARVRADERDRAAGRVEALAPDIRLSNNDGMGGMVVHADGTTDILSTPETFREFVELGRAIAAIREGGA
jgi:hypothetical protein